MAFFSFERRNAKQKKNKKLLEKGEFNNDFYHVTKQALAGWGVSYLDSQKQSLSLWPRMTCEWRDCHSKMICFDAVCFLPLPVPDLAGDHELRRHCAHYLRLVRLYVSTETASSSQADIEISPSASLAVVSHHSFLCVFWRSFLSKTCFKQSSVWLDWMLLVMYLLVWWPGPSIVCFEEHLSKYDIPVWYSPYCALLSSLQVYWCIVEIVYLSLHNHRLFWCCSFPHCLMQYSFTA